MSETKGIAAARDLSENAKKLIIKLIHPDPEKRPKVGKICEKKWFKEGRMASNEELKKYLKAWW